MERLGLAYQFDDFAWEPDGRAIDFTAASHGVASVWRIEVDPATLRWTRGPDRLTSGAGADTDVTVARDGRTIAFATAPRSSRLWSFALDPATGRITGEGQAITDAQWHASGPDLTADGKKLVYVVEHPGARHQRTWIERTIAGGSERSLLVDDLTVIDNFTAHEGPRWSPDGRRLLYRMATRAGTAYSTSTRVLDTVTSQDQQLTSPQTAVENPSGWSPDGKWILSSSTRHLPERLSLALLPADAGPRAEAKAEVITSDSLRCHILWQGAISPDNRWIAIQAASVPQGARSTLYVVPRTGGPWTQMTEGTYWDDKPRWSSDGRFLYFVSSRGGVINVWVVPFDPASGLPLGAPAPVTSFSGARRVLPQIASMQIAVAGDRLVLPIVDVSGGVWMLENVTR
jgi:Tol biopolymer transport system component